MSGGEKACRRRGRKDARGGGAADKGGGREETDANTAQRLLAEWEGGGHGVETRGQRVDERGQLVDPALVDTAPLPASVFLPLGRLSVTSTSSCHLSVFCPAFLPLPFPHALYALMLPSPLLFSFHALTCAASQCLQQHSQRKTR